jgi:hypothetical protein
MNNVDFEVEKIGNASVMDTRKSLSSAYSRWDAHIISRETPDVYMATPVGFPSRVSMTCTLSV